MPASSITRLPAGLRSRALRRLSANANAPGAGRRQLRRARSDSLSRLTTSLGIFAIESRPSSLAASIGGANGPISAVTLDTGGGVPATTAVTANELDAVTYAAGAKVVQVTLPATLRGEAAVAVSS